MKELISNLNKSTADLLTWVDDPASKEVLAKGSLVTSKKYFLKKNLWRIEKLKRSLDRNSAVSVFGPSQAGKSFLISILAKPENGDLVANYEGENNQINYISQINPAGDGESTGIVTRFTSERYSSPPEYPIKVTLLSEIDVICTLCNSFFLDGDQSEPIPTAEKIEEHLAKFEMTADQTAKVGVQIGEFWALEEYIETKFGKTAYANALIPYFEKITDLAPKLKLEHRAALYSLLWGFHDPLSNLFIKIIKFLESVKFCETLFLQKNALVPKSESIIDVKSLKKIDENLDDNLSVCTADNKKYSVNRSVLSALTSELTVPMESAPHTFLEHTDLLDFPGARNRFKRSLNDAFQVDDASISGETITLGGLLLRGKIAYLFDKYVAAQDITAMLLCVPEGNLDTIDLPILVENWLHETIGSTPEIRSLNENTLFFVLTKFDLHLKDNAAIRSENDRFKRRLEASLFEQFGKNKDNWLKNWDGHKSFKNCFWLRNPNVDQEYFEKNNNLELLTTDPKKLKRLNELETMYLSTEEVGKHFVNPNDAWDAAIAPNDGGSKYLVKGLTKVCKSGIKAAQVRTQLNNISKDILSRFEAYYVPDDFVKKKEIQVKKFQILESKINILINQNRFGEFLETLLIGSYMVDGHMLSLQNFRTDKIVEKTLETWVNNCDRLKISLIDKYQFCDETASFLLKELECLLSHEKLNEKLQEDIEFLAFGFKLDKQISSASTICCDGINSLISNPLFVDRSISIENIDCDTIQLPVKYSSVGSEIGRNWLRNFNAVVLDNLNMSSGKSIDVENNSRLGEILHFINEECLND